MPRNGIAGLHDNSVLSFLGTAILFSVVAVPVYVSAMSVGGFPFRKDTRILTFTAALFTVVET